MGDPVHSTPNSRDTRTRSWPALHRWGRATLDLFYPRDCLGCGEPVEGDGDFLWICQRCNKQLHRIEPPCCQTCGFPIQGDAHGPRSCSHCDMLEPHFAEGRALVLHQDIGGLIIREIKYRHGLHLLRDVRRLAARVGWLPAYLAESVLVPVPLHHRKLRERGYNQSCELALALGAELKLPVQDLLRRTRDTATQTRLDRTARRRNVKNAFALKPGAHIDLERSYVLIDDVFTTGATLNAAAEVLVTAGMKRLKVLTLAHG